MFKIGYFFNLNTARLHVPVITEKAGTLAAGPIVEQSVPIAKCQQIATGKSQADICFASFPDQDLTSNSCLLYGCLFLLLYSPPCPPKKAGKKKKEWLKFMARRNRLLLASELKGSIVPYGKSQRTQGSIHKKRLMC